MRYRRFCAFLMLLVANYHAAGTHLRAGEIQVTRSQCSNLTFQITILVYINYETNVRLGGANDILFFGDGTSIVVPEINDFEIVDASLSIAFQKYTVEHSYSTFGQYTISYNEGNRNPNILNVTASVNTSFNIETYILIEPGVCNISPRLLIPPIDRACSGMSFFHNPGAADADGDSLSFELAIPKQTNGAFVTDYKFPDNEQFYQTPYNSANEAGTGPPVFRINAIDGTLTWDAPGMIGEYVVAIKITEWKLKTADSTRYQAGYVIRDMQIIVEECSNRKPELTQAEDLCVIAGSLIDFTLTASDPDADSIIIEVFSDVLTRSEHAPVLTPSNKLPQATNPPHTAGIHFSWQTSCSDVQQQNHRIFFKISDVPTSGPKLVQFYTVNIKVIAPAPEYESVSVNPITKHATIDWKEHACDNVRAFQVWRRVSEYQYEQPECNNGMPAFLRYQLIAEVEDLTFTDTNLAFGSQYCYRIVALVGDNKTPGRISLDTCFIPKPAEAPVIVNVSIQETHAQNGEILVRWTHPFDIDKQQYPPPYHYKVFRKIETSTQPFEAVTLSAISDTLFVDSGLDTESQPYRYKIQLYVPALTMAPVDTSSEASSVFASSHSMINGIQLHWKANTPWYNYSQKYPYHLISRSTSPTGNFTLIDSVNVNEDDFFYNDLGQYDGAGLTNATYFYKIKTRGTYGNPGISEPIENFSQIIGGQVLDTIPPCKPLLTLASIDCSEFACDGNDYYSKLEWADTESTCTDDDLIRYEVLVKDDTASVYHSLGIVDEKQFLHTNIKSLNKCYRLVSIDGFGNRSDTSNVVCNSNCVMFKLPNVITPGRGDDRNDFLTSYSQDDNTVLDCARSVRRVDLTIFSRWGDEIFTTSLTDEDAPIYWDGRNAAGEEVSAGTYFYYAEVAFDTSDPSRQNQQIKGWVYVLR